MYEIHKQIKDEVKKQADKARRLLELEILRQAIKNPQQDIVNKYFEVKK